MLETLPFFADTGLSEWALWGLIIASYFTSALTAAFGIGGGVALLAILSTVIPVATLIPLHGMVQMGSNAGRAWHLRDHIKWSFLVPFGLGALIGTAVGSQLVIALPDALLKIILALFVLSLVWAPKPKFMKGGNVTIATGGALSSLAGMFVGATGPLVAAMIAGKADDRQGVVSTHAASMTLQHGLKILAFGFVGFAFTTWLGLIIAMIVSGYIGTITGGKILHMMDEKLFRKLFKLILTALAVFMLVKAAQSFF
ncbi:sulfite exporter TauE/SafE family protein [Cohaesibacter celericrescens]|uniref:Probable membrane transporter protein n=1 Tax=Cohaesibacter celericrescens TaxID=2067669 RepID=A0A2N5XU86_9HYPH|nr:sulfite exporter TauE/SafE family protein [Cohaesibacter celericrescens]PLW78082.1 sulfite exporter TauE/SafE family protein [Cohaesibacter celericrescens]